MQVKGLLLTQHRVYREAEPVGTLHCEIFHHLRLITDKTAHFSSICEMD